MFVCITNLVFYVVFVYVCACVCVYIYILSVWHFTETAVFVRV